MHSYHVSHRWVHLFLTKLDSYTDYLQSDIKFSNVMMDGSDLSSFPIHPFRDWTQRDGITEARFSTRTLHPVKYYLIDFGHSKVYDSSIPLDAILDSPRWGAGDPTIPEFVKDENCNPFAVDVYCVGNLMRNEITKVIVSFPTLLSHTHPLVRAMHMAREDEVLALSNLS